MKPGDCRYNTQVLVPRVSKLEGEEELRRRGVERKTEDGHEEEGRWKRKGRKGKIREEQEEDEEQG